MLIVVAIGQAGRIPGMPRDCLWSCNRQVGEPALKAKLGTAA